MADGRRRLAAIVAADVAGYSRLMAADEEGVIRALADLRAAIVEPRLADHHGRIANTAGDSFLIEFASAVDALRAALAIQAVIAERNASVPPDRRLLLRIGINVGDVVAQGEDLLGDGVNVAARLEAEAEPGGICISRSVRDQVRDRLDLDLEDLGEIAVKNIERPVRAFRAYAADAPHRAAPDHAGAGGETESRDRGVWVRVLAAGAAATLLALGLVLWRFEQIAHPEADDDPSVEETVASAPLAIAVLPFADRSDGADQGYFAQGVAEDIGTDLARLPGLTVTAPSAVSRFAAGSVDPRGAARMLGVAAVLEGSVRRESGTVRVTARLVDGANGAQLWAERFDRADKDLFAIQAEIADRVAEALAAKLGLESPPGRPIERPAAPKIEAYDAYIRGRAKRIPPTAKNLAAALKLFELAIALDPTFAGGYAGASIVHSLEAFKPRPTRPPAEHLADAVRLARLAVTADSAFGPGHGALAEALVRSGRVEEALAAIREAVRLAPNDSLMRATYGRMLAWAGRPREGVEQARLALRMSPDSPPPLFFLGLSQRAAGDFDGAVASLEEHRERLGGRIVEAPSLELAAAYVQAGRREDASALIARVLATVGPIDLGFAARTHPYARAEDLDAFVQALRAAGLPDVSE